MKRYVRKSGKRGVRSNSIMKNEENVDNYLSVKSRGASPYYAGQNE